MPARLRLAPEWAPSRDPATGDIAAAGRLWDFTGKIASSRREGKNRRDGATVSTRVVALTDRVGRQLYAEAMGAAAGKGAAATATLTPEEAASLRKVVGESKRRRRLENRPRL